MVNPHFKGLWTTEKPYVIAKGGRGSFKSSTISLKLATMMKKHIQQKHHVNIICVRENSTYLRDSVFKQVQWALDKLDIADSFTFQVSPMRIVDRKTGSTFYFYGGDDPDRLKSNTVQDVIAIWYEEASNFKSKEVFDQTNATFIRQKSPFASQVKVFFSYNPPKNPFAWVNKWVKEKEDDHSYYIDTSTYLDDELGFTGKQQLEMINTYKKNDPDYYRWLFLGKVVGLGDSIYNMNLFHKLESMPTDDHLDNIYFSLDSGHETSATTCGCYGVTAKGRVIVLDTYYYSPFKKSTKKAPSDLVRDVHDFEERNIKRWGMNPWKMSADSATADYAFDNEYYKEYAHSWHHVAKKQKTVMIDNVQNLLAKGNVYYLDTENNAIFIDEHSKYRWNADTLDTDDPRVIKEHDHTCDSFQYFVLDNLRDLNLTW